jgi:predicted secreted protein
MPGQTRSFSESWDQRNNDGQTVSPGTYMVAGIYSGIFLVSQPQSFTIGGSGTTGRWVDRPPTSAGATASCPSERQWSLVYWDGGTTAISTAAGACEDADGFWVNRSGRWLGFSKDSPAASDIWQTVLGEAHFAHGKPAGQEPVAAEITVSCNEFTNVPAAPGAPVVVTRSIGLSPGQSLVVTLCSNPTTGFQWEPAVIGTPTVIVQTDRRYVPPGSTLPGPPGSERLTFQAQAAGSSTIALDYSRPWEGGEKGVWQFRLTVLVK